MSGVLDFRQAPFVTETAMLASSNKNRKEQQKLSRLEDPMQTFRGRDIKPMMNALYGNEAKGVTDGCKSSGKIPALLAG
jgi:murein tripeptide amidase MpaA